MPLSTVRLNARDTEEKTLLIKTTLIWYYIAKCVYLFFYIFVSYKYMYIDIFKELSSISNFTSISEYEKCNEAMATQIK